LDGAEDEDSTAGDVKAPGCQRLGGPLLEKREKGRTPFSLLPDVSKRGLYSPEKCAARPEYASEHYTNIVDGSSSSGCFLAFDHRVRGALDVCELEGRWVLQAISKHPVHADVGYPDKAYFAEQRVVE
jgi:hypothetical protein